MSLIESKYVPSEGDPSSNLWVIGEAPGYDETAKGRPFIGPAGDLLRSVFRTRAGLEFIDIREQRFKPKEIFFTNLCHYRPKENKFKHLYNSPQLEDGINEIKSLLAQHSPNCILLLGAEPLRYICNKRGISNYRGSIIPSTIIEDRKIKCVASLHPSYVLQDKKKYPLFDFDVRRAVEERVTKRFNYPELDIRLFGETGWEEFFEAALHADELDVDIESVKETTIIRCISFTHADYKAVVFPWNSDAMFHIMSLLSNESKKSFHNGIFDYNMLRINGIETKNYTDDTLLMAHVLEPQLPRSLATLVSLYTRMPYYKHEGKSDKGEGDTKGWGKKAKLDVLMKYCGKDTIGTRAVRLGQIEDLKQARLYDFYKNYEMVLQEVALDLCLQGLLVDEERRNIFKEACKVEYKKYYNILWNLNSHEDVNPNSPKQVAKLLYTTHGLPKRINKKTGEVTTNEDALVSLMSHCETELGKLKREDARLKWKLKLAVIKTLLKLRYWNKLYTAYIKARTYEGRMKSTWKVAGTETGRPAASTFYDGSGLALTTIPRGDIEVNEHIPPTL